jgi:hypothetical protein
MTLTGTLASDRASGYLQQLCKHFAHKLEVSFTPETGRIAFGFGSAELTAADGLLRVTLTLQPDADPAQAKHVIDKHLAVFTHREGGVGLTWGAAG